MRRAVHTREHASSRCYPSSVAKSGCDPQTHKPTNPHTTESPMAPPLHLNFFSFDLPAAASSRPWRCQAASGGGVKPTCVKISSHDWILLSTCTLRRELPIRLGSAREGPVDRYVVISRGRVLVLRVRQACTRQTWVRSRAKSAMPVCLRKSFRDAQSARKGFSKV